MISRFSQKSIKLESVKEFIIKISFIIFIIITLLAIYFLYKIHIIHISTASNYNGIDLELTSTIGDFIGGLFGSLLGFLGVLLLIYTILQQRVDQNIQNSFVEFQIIKEIINDELNQYHKQIENIKFDYSDDEKISVLQNFILSDDLISSKQLFLNFINKNTQELTIYLTSIAFCIEQCFEIIDHSNYINIQQKEILLRRFNSSIGKMEFTNILFLKECYDSYDIESIRFDNQLIETQINILENLYILSVKREDLFKYLMI